MVGGSFISKMAPTIRAPSRRALLQVKGGTFLIMGVFMKEG
jgi:hypothetical protein